MPSPLGMQPRRSQPQFYPAPIQDGVALVQTPLTGSAPEKSTLNQALGQSLQDFKVIGPVSQEFIKLTAGLELDTFPSKQPGTGYVFRTASAKTMRSRKIPQQPRFFTHLFFSQSSDTCGTSSTNRYLM